MKYTTAGILAHVDAGKTTLCEAMLFIAGSIRRLGRVDHRDSWLDSHALERERGITIFSKQAELAIGEHTITLLDTPGHVDFSAETERVLSVLDMAVLVISGSEGVQQHTLTLWKLLRRYNVPTIIFVSKMDLGRASEQSIMRELTKQLSPACVNCSGAMNPDGIPEQVMEDAAALSEPLMEKYLDGNPVTHKDIAALFADEQLFPVFFGSGLQLQGVDSLLKAMDLWAPCPVYGDEFGAKVYKISRDSKGARLTHLKVTGGELKVRDSIAYRGLDGEETEEKITSIRYLSGEKSQNADNAPCGSIVAVSGLTHSYAGQGLGFEQQSSSPILEPVLSYRVKLIDNTDAKTFLPKLQQLEEEDPSLKVVWDSALGEIHLRLMGEIQTQVLTRLIADRFGVQVEFDEGEVLYKETIEGKVEGVGHFEPLRHYAEVHLLIEEAARGSGISLGSRCSTDSLALNWQRLILYNLEQKQHIGVLGGYPLTDVNISIASGKAHLKHTEGGDFRQATLRAVRQGLMQARSVLLEPVYSYRLTLPTAQVGRAIGDIRLMSGTFKVDALSDDISLVTGRAPVSEMQGYASVLTAYTSGQGKLSCTPDGYEKCHNTEQVLARRGYDPTRDIDNTPDSVFCRRGAGFNVPWNEVRQYMHLESALSTEKTAQQTSRAKAVNLDEKALEALLEREFGPIRRKQYGTPQTVHEAKPQLQAEAPRRQHLLVDAYNVIFSWEDLSALAERGLDLARVRFMDIMANYSGFTGCDVVLVFDAYRSTDDTGKRFNHHGIEVVFTQNGETADAYLERLAQQIGKDDAVKVVSSDNLVRLGAFRSGVQRMSSKALEEEVTRVSARIAEIIEKSGMPTGSRIGDILSKEELEEWRRKMNL